MAIITKNLKIIRNLYSIIREHKTSFEQTLKNSLNIIVTQYVNLKKKDEAYDRVDLKHQEVALFAKFGANEEKCAFIEAMSAEKTDFQKYKG